jgi:hypothetical protein
MKKLALLFGVLAIALFSACGEQAEEGDTTQTDVTDETELAEVTISNGLEAYDIYYIMIDPSDEPWGEDRLGEDILAPGESITIEVEPGTWDMQVIDVDGDTYTLWQVEVGAEGYEWNVTLDDIDSDWGDGEIMEPRIIEAGEGAGWVSIVNDLQGYDVFYVYVSPVDSDDWGEDWLGAEILYQDDELIVWIEPGVYDIQLVDEDGDTYTRWEQTIDENGYEWWVTLDDLDMITDEGDMGAMVLESGEGTAPVTIVNDLGAWDIYYVYVDASDSPWGDDRLGADILTAESQITVWVDPGNYDMQVEDEDGDTYTIWGVEVGEDGYTWNVTLADMD